MSCSACRTALLLARKRFRGKAALQAIIDLPFAVSPVVIGVALILLWGSAGLLGLRGEHLGFKIIFGLPGIVLASIFVTVPFVIREVEPVLHELGTDQEEAAATLGSTWWQTFWRITLPSIRWGLTYGIVLTVARTLGEYGAVLMVSSNMPGKSQTLTLLVSDRYNRGAEYGAYAISTLLMSGGRAGAGGPGDPRRAARSVPDGGVMTEPTPDDQRHRRQRRQQALRRLRRAGQRRLRRADGIADRTAGAQRLREVDPVARHRRALTSPTAARW